MEGNAFKSRGGRFRRVGESHQGVGGMGSEIDYYLVDVVVVVSAADESITYYKSKK